ncbi:5-methylcytosine restriction system specificity protein McrC [Nocardia brasiliensis]|uniref:5-methylcytosine restriction system specificity protein McrC n=1 Tax=Nocardia brasiliensis TaxID=37326 RepID=UPI0024557236|nr:hypothetical protein [Nocardia brasiliensis]
MVVVVVECEEFEQIDIDSKLWLGPEHEAIFDTEIAGRDILRTGFSKGKVRLQAGSYVGVIPINEHVIVRVKPRVPISNLTRMVVETGHSTLPLRAFRDYPMQGTAGDWAMNLYADALLNYVDEVLDQGLLRKYEQRYGAGHFPHGRIELNETIQRFAARGIPNKAAYSWFERSVDTSANRCVRAAMEAVHAHLTKSNLRKGDRAKLARLAGQLSAFAEVYYDTDYLFLEDPEVLGLTPLPDHRSYYRPLLDLAVAILKGKGLALELGTPDIRMGSLLIEMGALFENFVRVSLAKYAATQGWPVAVLDGNSAGRVDLYHVPNPLPAPHGVPLPAVASRNPGKAQPDVVLRHIDGAFLLVGEIKNSPHGTDGLPDRGEVQQAVIYALRYALDLAVLIHPWVKGTKGLVYIGRIQTIDVYDYRLDLSTADGIDQALQDMATTLGRLAGLS